MKTNTTIDGMKQVTIIDYTYSDQDVISYIRKASIVCWLLRFSNMIIFMLSLVAIISSSVFVFLKWFAVNNSDVYHDIVVVATLITTSVILMVAIMIATRKIEASTSNKVSTSPMCRSLAHIMGVDSKDISVSVERFMMGLEYQIIEVKLSGGKRVAGISWGSDKRTIHVWAPNG